MLKSGVALGAAAVALLLGPSPALAQSDGTNCPPVLNGDGTVTFRYCQPADTVSVNGEWDAPATRAMTRDIETGVWSVTLPLRNHLYSYRINVNGTLIDDFGLWSPAGGGSAAPTVAQLSQPGPQGLTAVHIGSGTNDVFGAQNNTAATAVNLTATGIPYECT